MMKWRVRRDSQCSSVEHEDIRRSLEVLDSVLAEFDDCLDSWDSAAPTEECKVSESIPELRKKFEQIEDPPNGHLSNGLSKSHSRLALEKVSLDGDASHNSASEQPLSPPPPIPKRSPTTRLSENNKNNTQFTFPTDDISADSSSEGLSKTALSSSHGNGVDCDKCSNCGAGLKRNITNTNKEVVMEQSPFTHRRQMFEQPKPDREQNKASVGRSRSFKVKRMVADIMDSSEHSSLPPDLSFASDNSCSVPNCDCRDRIRHLQEKFAETKRLLRQKKIKVLDCEPPSFVPPPPGGDSVVPKTSDDMEYSSLEQSFYSADGSNDDSSLCNKCSTALSETIEDILPHLLPTDVLNRPHLGFSYSMEEDLSPEVKEIGMTTSTPKSNPSLFRTKESSLSTFSQSASSLGYVSSQSDLELNNISPVPDKVPVSTFKSMTLPNAGLERSPFYSAVDDDPETSRQKSWQNDLNDNRVHKGHLSVEELRSSSEEKPKKKHFRGFSRKSKKDKKSDDSLSLKSDVSTDEGVILKKLSALDGSTFAYDAAPADKTESGGEKKRWSLLRSIIGKKSP